MIVAGIMLRCVVDNFVCNSDRRPGHDPPVFALFRPVYSFY
jgi:hypothetical protein